MEVHYRHLERNLPAQLFKEENEEREREGEKHRKGCIRHMRGMVHVVQGTYEKIITWNLPLAVLQHVGW